MQYRPFGKLDFRVSALGFGAMRLPFIGKDMAKIDEPQAERMIRYAVDHGVNYIDTAYPYHMGQSEPVVGRALRDGYRQKVKLATKLPSWMIRSLEDCDRYLNEQLQRLQTDTIDFYLLHGLNREYWPKLRDIEVLKWAEAALADGRIQHLGFSFHDQYELFEEIVDAYHSWTFCQIQYNYVDVDYQAGIKGLKYATDRGLAVVVMEPIRGGQLAKEPPERIKNLWGDALNRRTLPEWALQWVWNHPEVSVVLSGMSTMQQVEENVAFAERSAPVSLTEEELALIDRVREAYRNLAPIPCTNCMYCMPCPNGVNIPRIFEIYNDAIVHGDLPTARLFYRGPFVGLKEEQRADRCIECKECEEVCPQEIPVTEWLPKAHDLLGPGKK
ncbi:aldo/keto reductase [Thermodesulfobacteriota bacterium]